METEYFELLGWPQFTQFPPAMHQHFLLNKSHHLEEKQVWEGIKEVKKAKKMAQPNLGGIGDPLCAGTGILSWRKIKQYLVVVLVCARAAPPWRRWNSGLE